MSDNSEDLAQIELRLTDWVILAAIAWDGYRVNGRGVLILELSEDEDTNDEHQTNNAPLYYFPADANEIRDHVEQNEELARWITQYNPENSILLGIAHPVGVFYSYLETPTDYSPPPEANPKDPHEISDALNFQESPIIKQWPMLAGIARSHYAGLERGVIVIDISAPSDAHIKKAVERALEKAERQLLRTLQDNAPVTLAEHNSNRIGFETRLAERWGKALGIFETTLIIAQESGGDFLKRHQEKAASENDLVFGVLTHLHARACLTASEVLALLRSGHAGGAHSRWRTLHEIAAVSYFVKRFGQEVAQRYLEHENIEAKRAANEYQQHCIRLGYEPYTSSEMESFQREYDRLLAKYGSDFAQNYGWAVDAYCEFDPSFRGRRVGFPQIEHAAGISHLRPYYRMASHAIHANPKGITFNLGLIKQRELLLAGPSNYGLTDPGHGACISLSQVTTTLLGLKPDFESIMVMKALQHFVDEAGDAFLEAQRKINDDEIKLRLSDES